MVKKIIVFILIVSFSFAVTGEGIKGMSGKNKVDSQILRENKVQHNNGELDTHPLRSRELSSEEKLLSYAAGTIPMLLSQITLIVISTTIKTKVSDALLYTCLTIPFLVDIGAWIGLQKYAENRINYPENKDGKVSWRSYTGKQLTKYYCLGTVYMMLFETAIISLLLLWLALALSSAMSTT